MELVDDRGESIELGHPQYDVNIGELVSLEQDDEMVVIREVFTEDVLHEVSVEEFEQEGMSIDFLRIPDSVIANPKRVVENALFTDEEDLEYRPWEVRFAWKTLDCSVKDL